VQHLGRHRPERHEEDRQEGKLQHEEVPVRRRQLLLGEPGVAPEVCEYLAAKKISMIGSDTWGLEPYDFAKGVPESFAYCHMNLVARRGISNFENLDLDDLSTEKAYEFLFAWAPLKLVGATGSPGNPVASFVTFVHVVRPTILALSGAQQQPLTPMPVRAGFTYRKKIARREYVRVTLRKSEDGALEAMKFPREGAGLLSSLVDTDGLVELGEQVTLVEPGQTVGFLSYASLI